MIKYLEKENLLDVLSEDITLVDFYADWCGPCQMLGMELEEMENVNIIKINTDTHNKLAQEHGIMSIPYVEIYKNKEKVNSFLGFKTKEDIYNILKKLK